MSHLSQGKKKEVGGSGRSAASQACRTFRPGAHSFLLIPELFVIASVAVNPSLRHLSRRTEHHPFAN